MTTIIALTIVAACAVVCATGFGYCLKETVNGINDQERAELREKIGKLEDELSVLSEEARTHRQYGRNKDSQVYRLRVALSKHPELSRHPVFNQANYPTPLTPEEEAILGPLDFEVTE